MATSRLSTTPAQASQSRVFIIEGGARADHQPSYESCVRMLGISQGFGDIERIECPDPMQYGKFIEVGQIRGATERPTTSLEGRFMRDARSTLLRIAKQACSFDVQLHFGACQDPSSFNTFDKILILEGAQLTNFGTDDLGALASGDNAAVNENADLSAADMYEIVPLTTTSVAGTVVTNEIIDVVICDTVSCGDCDEESDGCNKIFGLSLAAGGSPGTAADVVFSTDRAVTWLAHDVDTLGAAEAPNGLDCVGDYLVVVSAASDSLHYAPKADFNSVDDPSFTEVSTGIVAAGSPLAIWSSGNQAFIVGQGGYVYTTEDPTAGVTVLSAGAAVSDDLLDVHGISSTFAVAVGNSGAVVYTENGTVWGATTTRPVGAGIHLNTVWVKGEKEWLVGTSDGRLFYTLDKGVTWTLKGFPGSGSGVVRDIAFSTPSVGYLAHSTTTPRGRVLRTYDGGFSWLVTPEASGTMPLNDRVTSLAACSTDPNFAVGGGLADDGSDGFMVVLDASS